MKNNLCSSKTIAIVFVCFGFLLGQFCVLVRAEESEKPTPPKIEIHWGQKDESGMHMGAWKVPSRLGIYCVVSNHGERAVFFNDYFMGYFEAIFVWARSEGEEDWIKLELTDSRFRGSKSAGPDESNTIMLTSGKSHTANAKHHPADEPQENLSSFVLYLSDYKWPSQWKGDLEIKVEQRLPNFSGKEMWEGVLESGPIKVSAEDIKEAEEISKRNEERNKKIKELFSYPHSK